LALAAGRFQPILRWDVEKRFGDILTNDEARELAASLESKVAACIPSYHGMGDNCDFVTLAGDWPYRYNPQSVQEGPKAFDDLIGPNGRWPGALGVWRPAHRRGLRQRLPGDVAAYSSSRSRPFS